MILQVQISEKNKSEIMSAIRLLRGVREVSESYESRESKKSCKSNAEKLPIETKADYQAWKKARKELERGESISLEEFKKKYKIK